ncbi:hypothetical protein, partial [Endobacterium cereale]|uniref:hypothetical protein n=1 Tax=Endobacterium cereale TaxID=2663029 RepID=UPI001AD950AA
RTGTDDDNVEFHHLPFGKLGRIGHVSEHLFQLRRDLEKSAVRSIIADLQNQRFFDEDLVEPVIVISAVFGSPRVLPACQRIAIGYQAFANNSSPRILFSEPMADAGV